jgi:CPA2 family monovalent cation:H+ antiporter-2
MLLIAVLGLCFGISLLSAKLGYSVALGAFLIGAVIAESREIGRVQSLTEPIRDMFSAVFFVAIGLLIDPKMIAEHALPIAVISLAIVLGKILTCSAGVLLTGRDARTSLRAGMGLAQIGEFSFIIAALGGTLGVTSGFLYPTAVCVSAITTFLTPYLIRWSDPLAETIYRAAPRRLRGVIELYGRRVRGIGRARAEPAGAGLARRLARRLLFQVTIVAAAFLAARLVPSRYPGRLALLPEWLGGERTVLWAAAVIVSLPILVMTFRTLRALGTLLGGMSIHPSDAGEQTWSVRTVVSGTVVIAGGAGLALLVVVLSSAILPPWHVLVVLLLVLGGTAVLAWRPIVRLYEKAEQALQGTLAQAGAGAEDAALGLTAALGEIRLERIEVSGCAVGRRIRELEIRSRTGASVVAIDSDHRRVVNPSPDEELQAGDHVFLLGSPAQCRAARALLAGQPHDRPAPAPHS